MGFKDRVKFNRKRYKTTETKSPEPDMSTETLSVITDKFNGRKSIGKADLLAFANNKTLFGKTLKSTDKIIFVNVINEMSLESKFISISPKIIAFSEINKVSRQFVPILNGKRLLTIVKKKVLNNKEYSDKIRLMEYVPTRKETIEVLKLGWCLLNQYINEYIPKMKEKK